MINVLTGLGYGIIGLAITIGIGLVVLGALATNVSNCGTGFTYQTNGTATYTTQLCCNNSAATCSVGANSSGISTPATNINAISVFLGTGSGGLASFIPLVIIIVIGLLFLGLFMGKKGKSYG